jgi:hypothetical protein
LGPQHDIYCTYNKNTAKGHNDFFALYFETVFEYGQIHIGFLGTGHRLISSTYMVHVVGMFLVHILLESLPSFQQLSWPKVEQFPQLLTTKRRFGRF